MKKTWLNSRHLNASKKNSKLIYIDCLAITVFISAIPPKPSVQHDLTSAQKSTPAFTPSSPIEKNHFANNSHWNYTLATIRYYEPIPPKQRSSPNIYFFQPLISHLLLRMSHLISLRLYDNACWQEVWGATSKWSRNVKALVQVHDCTRFTPSPFHRTP